VNSCAPPSHACFPEAGSCDELWGLLSVASERCCAAALCHGVPPRCIAAAEAAASLGGLSAATVAPLSSDYAWQQLPAPPANALEAAAADPAAAAALAALESVVNNAPPLEGVTDFKAKMYHMFSKLAAVTG
jgi:hypothetical protein